MSYVSLENFKPVPTKDTAGMTGRKTPVREFLLFPWGENVTTHGILQFDKDCAAQLMDKYRAYTERRDGWLDIDIAHLSQTNDDEPMAHVSAGKFRTETREDGQWVTDLTYTPEVFELVANEELKYYSPVVMFDDKSRITELQQMALTNIPAMYNAQPLALSITGFQSWPVSEKAWDASAAMKRAKAYCGDDLKKLAKFYAYVDDPELVSTWKAPIGDVEGGKPVINKRAVQALAGSIQGARGNKIDVPANELPKLKALVERYYKKWGAEVPWKSKNSRNRKGIHMSRRAGKFGLFSRVAMALVCLEARKKGMEEEEEEVSRKMEEEGAAVAKPSMEKLFEALEEALEETLPGAHMEDVYEDHAVVGLPFEESGRVGEKYAKVPYEVMEDGRIQLGTPIEVKKSWIPIEPGDSAEEEGYEEEDDAGRMEEGARKHEEEAARMHKMGKHEEAERHEEEAKRMRAKAAGGEKMEDEEKMKRMSQRLSSVEKMLFDATGKHTVSAAIGEIERLKTSGGADLAAKVARLEARSFEAEKQVLLSSAKKSGKWTAALEKLALSNAERARKLNEDPIAAMREVFDSAPVSVAPGRETPPEHEVSDFSGGQMALSAAEKQQLEADAKRYGVDPKIYVQRFLENRAAIGNIR